jgi:hypothetical protein
LHSDAKRQHQQQTSNHALCDMPHCRSRLVSQPRAGVQIRRRRHAIQSLCAEQTSNADRTMPFEQASNQTIHGECLHTQQISNEKIAQQLLKPVRFHCRPSDDQQSADDQQIERGISRKRAPVIGPMVAGCPVFHVVGHFARALMIFHVETIGQAGVARLSVESLKWTVVTA